MRKLKVRLRVKVSFSGNAFDVRNFYIQINLLYSSHHPFVPGVVKNLFFLGAMVSRFFAAKPLYKAILCIHSFKAFSQHVLFHNLIPTFLWFIIFFVDPIAKFFSCFQWCSYIIDSFHILQPS